MKAEKKQSHRHILAVYIIHPFPKDLLSTHYMPGTVLGPGTTVILTSSKRKGANEPNNFFLDLFIPIVRHKQQTTVAVVPARFLVAKTTWLQIWQPKLILDSLSSKRTYLKSDLDSQKSGKPGIVAKNNA